MLVQRRRSRRQPASGPHRIAHDLAQHRRQGCRAQLRSGGKLRRRDGADGRIAPLGYGTRRDRDRNRASRRRKLQETGQSHSGAAPAAAIRIPPAHHSEPRDAGHAERRRHHQLPARAGCRRSHRYPAHRRIACACVATIAKRPAPKPTAATHVWIAKQDRPLPTCTCRPHADTASIRIA